MGHHPVRSQRLLNNIIIKRVTITPIYLSCNVINHECFIIFTNKFNNIEQKRRKLSNELGHVTQYEDKIILFSQSNHACYQSKEWGGRWMSL